MQRIYDKHKHWIKIVKSFGEEYYAEDIVQEAYLKVNGKDINEAYFYWTLRSLTMDLHRKKVIKVEIEENQITTESDFDFSNIENYYKIIDTFEWYDKKLFLLYIDNDFSIRDLAKETGIGFMSIYNTIKNCKQKLKLWAEKESL